MLKNFFLYNGLAACSINKGEKIIFSPYNLSVGVLDGNKNEVSAFETVQKLGSFGTPSNQGPALSDNFDLTLVITNDCNLRCRYCFAQGGEKRDYMSTDVALSIVNNVFLTTDRRYVKISFFGGEPTLNFEVIKNVVSFVKILAPSLNKGYSFYITTNGVMARRTLEFLTNNDFTFVVSSDGIPISQNFLRPTSNKQPSSEYVEKTISFLVKRNIPFKVRSTISKYNVNYMAENVRYFSDLGVRTVHFEPVTHAGRGKSDDINLERAKIDEYVRNFMLALEVAKNHNVSIISSSYMNFLAPSHKFCDAMAGSRLVGSYNGDITLCVEVQDTCHPYSTNAIVGHSDGKKMFFDHKKHEEITGNVATQNTDCNQCFARYCCGGGCPVKNFYSSGCGRADPYRCSLTKEIFKNILERIYHESVVSSNMLYKSNTIALYRMQVPQEIWMKRKTSKISNVLADIIIGEDNESVV